MDVAADRGPKRRQLALLVLRMTACISSRLAASARRPSWGRSTGFSSGRSTPGEAAVGRPWPRGMTGPASWAFRKTQHMRREQFENDSQTTLNGAILAGDGIDHGRRGHGVSRRRRLSHPCGQRTDVLHGRLRQHADCHPRAPNNNGRRRTAAAWPCTRSFRRGGLQSYLRDNDPLFDTVRPAYRIMEANQNELHAVGLHAVRLHRRQPHGLRPVATHDHPARSRRGLSDPVRSPAARPGR